MIQQGDKCWVQLGKKHYGICTGYGPDGEPWFVHNVRDRGVVHDTRKGFAGNRPIYIEQHATRGHEAAVADRAKALIGQSYDLLGFNCEHVANLAFSGHHVSYQLRQGVALTALGTWLLALFAFVANENGTTVDRNGYRRNAGGRFANRRWVR